MALDGIYRQTTKWLNAEGLLNAKIFFILNLSVMISDDNSLSQSTTLVIQDHKFVYLFHNLSYARSQISFSDFAYCLSSFRSQSIRAANSSIFLSIKFITEFGFLIWKFLCYSTLYLGNIITHLVIKKVKKQGNKCRLKCYVLTSVINSSWNTSKKCALETPKSSSD